MTVTHQSSRVLAHLNNSKSILHRSACHEVNLVMTPHQILVHWNMYLCCANCIVRLQTVFIQKLWLNVSSYIEQRVSQTK